jgi:pyruvate,water dikinase
MDLQNCRVLWFESIGLDDIALVGGKNANLGELSRMQKNANIMVPPGFALTTVLYREFIKNADPGELSRMQKNVNILVPPGFVLTTVLYREFIKHNQLGEQISEQLQALSDQKQNLSTTGTTIRQAILAGEFSDEQRTEITDSYQLLCEKVGLENCDVAVRSSATAEDLPEASFAGQQESYLNIQGPDALIASTRACIASLFTDRAIAYREQQGVNNQGIALAVGVQQMVRSDKGCSGVMFTIDTETGFPDGVLINASWGLGESIVKGSVTPDRYMVFKPLLANKEFTPIIEKQCGSKLVKMIYRQNIDTQTDIAAQKNTYTDFTETIATTMQEQRALVLNNEEIILLANWATAIERIYDKPMDIEWAKDGATGNFYIVQARPETVESRKDRHLLKTYYLKQNTQETPKVLAKGASVGNAIVSGKVFYLNDPSEGDNFPAGAILVTERTDPDWVPIMKKATGIITDLGGTTSHAAIVSRELQVPAIVGTGNATQTLSTEMQVTMDCASGSNGEVLSGALEFGTQLVQLDEIPSTKTAVMLNVAVPDGALRWWQLPIAGIGLARIEFIIASVIKAHPMALIHPEKVTDPNIFEDITTLIGSYQDGAEYFIDTLANGIAKIAASVYPKPAIVRFSDFKTNEYKSLLGGEYFEKEEPNPMLGLRGASRYYHASYREAFKLECQSIKQVREKKGFENVIVMVPFCRTPKEADEVLALMAKYGLQRGSRGLQVYMMCEIPANVVLAEQFAKKFDGFSIGSNDLTQLILGIDRDSAELANLFDPKNEAVTRMIADVIKQAHKQHIKIGICGQAPSDYPEFAAFLVECGIDSISLNPDSVASTINTIAQAENEMLQKNNGSPTEDEF